MRDDREGHKWSRKSDRRLRQRVALDIGHEWTRHLPGLQHFGDARFRNYSVHCALFPVSRGRGRVAEPARARGRGVEQVAPATGGGRGEFYAP